MLKTFLSRSGAALATALLCSCASVTVDHVQSTSASQKQKAPRQIVVNPFVVEASAVRENSMRQHKGQLAAETQKLLSAYVVSELNKAGFAATAGQSARGRETWVVRGRITKLSEGSRLLRMGIGLGAGGTKMATIIDVTQAGSSKPFLQFATSGGSNAMPGAATNPIPFSSAPQALLNSKDGVTDDAARTARMIAGTITDYAAKKGLVKPSTTAPKPKYAQP